MHGGVTLDDQVLQYIIYADDLCLIANNANDLQLALNSLEIYCDKNNLSVNVAKSKVLPSLSQGQIAKVQTTLQAGRTRKGE